MTKTVKLNKNRKSVKELMSIVVDENLLKERKEKAETKSQVKQTEKNKDEEKPKDLNWYQKPILEKDFIYKEVDGEFFAHHKEWNKRVWIGGYPSEYEAKQVVKDYCKESKKDILQRNIKNIHSVLFGE